MCVCVDQRNLGSEIRTRMEGCKNVLKHILTQEFLKSDIFSQLQKCHFYLSILMKASSLKVLLGLCQLK